MKEKHELEKVEWGVIAITLYRGCLVTRLIGGYEVFGKKALTTADVDTLIDNAQEHLKNSIK